MTTPSSEPAPLRVDTLPALQLAQRHIQDPDPLIKAAAETLMSFLVLHLKHRECVVPPECVPALRRLMQTNKP